MRIGKKKEKRQQKQKANSTGRSYSAPKPVRELLLVCQLQIILGEKLFGPQARLRITPIAWFEPATSMTSLALVGGEGEEVCLTESAVERFGSRIKETNRTKN